MSGLFFDNWDTPVFRPPSESGSFILRVTRGCAHNSCTYCNMYRGVRFEKLSDDEIMRQIAMAYSVDRDGVRRVFLADGDALVLPTERLLSANISRISRASPRMQRRVTSSENRPMSSSSSRKPASPCSTMAWKAETRRR